MKKEIINYAQISPFNFSITNCTLSADSIKNEYNSHIHSECEIYINVSGDVSFMVEGHIYPIKHGDIIITRPYEYHHCIYNSDGPHEHFWILFNCDGNEHILDMFFKRKVGTNNLLSLENNDCEKLISHCHKMLENNQTETEKYLNFFKLLSFLENAKEFSATEKLYHNDTLYAIKYINQNYSSRISMTEIARTAHVSINTLERHFAENIKMSPSMYLKKTRLAKAAKLLTGSFSVSEVAEKCGFSDYSTFISEFKKAYDITPLKYKKMAKDRAN